MKSIVFIFLFISFVCQGQDQDSTSYQNYDTITYLNERHEKVCCKDSAFFTRIGKYDHGIYDGEITDYMPSGKVYMTGAYTRWVRSGLFKYYFPNGKRMCTGNYMDYEFTFINGWDSLGNKIVKNGNGYFKWFNPYNGKVSSEGNYKDGKRIGRWIFYNLDGNKTEESEHIEKELSIQNRWDETGQMQQVVNGDGESIWYYKNGQLKYKGVYKDGKREGEWVWYYPDGKLMQKLVYYEGKLNGELSFYYDNGILRKKIFYKDGKANGPVSWYSVEGNRKCAGFFTNNQQTDVWQWFSPNGTEKNRHDFGKTIIE